MSRRKMKGERWEEKPSTKGEGREHKERQNATRRGKERR